MATLWRFLLMACVVGTCGCGSAIGTLMELSSNEKLKQQAVREETANFEKVKDYIQNNKIQKGLPKDIAIKKFGEPILKYDEATNEKWVYKPASSDWFKGEKIYLFFDTNNQLEHWECINCK